MFRRSCVWAMRPVDWGRRGVKTAGRQCGYDFVWVCEYVCASVCVCVRAIVTQRLTPLRDGSDWSWLVRLYKGFTPRSCVVRSTHTHTYLHSNTLMRTTWTFLRISFHKVAVVSPNETIMWSIYSRVGQLYPQSANAALGFLFHVMLPSTAMISWPLAWLISCPANS